MVFLLFFIGLLSIVVQVILLRELSAAFYGVDLIYLLALGAWLLWTGAGALLNRRSLHASALRIRTLLAGGGGVLLLDIALVRRLPLLVGGVTGAYLPLPEQILLTVLCVMPPSLLLGMLFQAVAKTYLPSTDARQEPGAPTRSRSLARAYAIESLGGVAGGLLTTWTLHLGMQNLALACAVAAGAFLAAAGSLRYGVATDGSARRRELRSLRLQTAGAIALAAVCVFALSNAASLDRWTASWLYPDVVSVSDTPYGRITLTDRAGQVSVYENGALTFESEGTDSEDFAHISLLQHPSPRRVLAIGGGAACLLADIARHHPDVIDDVDLNAQLVHALQLRLPDRFATDGAAVHLDFDDPRRAMASARAHYDVIVIAAAEPASAQANRFFTREFFEECAARLAAGGVLSTRLPSVENLWTPALTARTASIYAALGHVFRDVVVLPGGTNIVLASNAALTRDPDVLAARLGERGIHARLVTARYLRYLYENDRYREIQQLLEQAGARENTDANAACYQATSLLWLSKFVPSLAYTDLAWIATWCSWRTVHPWLLLAAALAIALLWRRGRLPRRAVLVGLVACSGMMLETLLIVYYQLKHGVLFQDLGVLLMSVMAGLAAGAMIVDVRPTGARARARGAVLLIVIALGLAVSTGIRAAWDAALPPIAATLFIAGAAVAAVFALASQDDAGSSQRRLVSSLYAADVLGGAIGSVVASLVVIPLLGLPATAEWTAALALVGLALV